MNLESLKKVLSVIESEISETESNLGQPKTQPPAEDISVKDESIEPILTVQFENITSDDKDQIEKEVTR